MIDKQTSREVNLDTDVLSVANLKKLLRIISETRYHALPDLPLAYRFVYI